MVLNAPPSAPNPPAIFGVPTSTILQMHHSLAEIKGLLADIKSLQPAPAADIPPALYDGLANVNAAAESPLLQRVGPYVVIEALPGSGATSATITVQDMAPSGALQTIADALGVITVSGRTKYVVGGLQQMFKVKVSALVGTWSFLIGFTDSSPLLGSRGAKSAPANIVVGNTATLILAANPNRRGASIANNGSATLFLGRDNTVTAANGYAVPAAASFNDALSLDAWWGITSAGGGDARVIEVS